MKAEVFFSFFFFRNNGCLASFKCPNKKGVTTPNVGELQHFIKSAVSFSGDVYFLKLKIFLEINYPL